MEDGIVPIVLPRLYLLDLGDVDVVRGITRVTVVHRMPLIGETALLLLFICLVHNIIVGEVVVL